jgi:hypothetical protein
MEFIPKPEWTCPDNPDNRLIRGKICGRVTGCLCHFYPVMETTLFLYPPVLDDFPLVCDLYWFFGCGFITFPIAFQEIMC